ncbi:penicillin acylase [Acrasis kona]|uniref:Penicillin acylase n=1 Tax=Acrasis kona TaxID=1008807 RepID=A0AAW2ZNA6_9EUKA
MASYGGTSNYGDAYGADNQNIDTSEPSAWQKITHNRWTNLVLLLLYLVVIGVTIACVTLIFVFHKHLVLQCGYAEFIIVLLLAGLVLVYSLYQLIGIFKFFKRRASRSSHKGLAAAFDPILYTDLDDEHFQEQAVDGDDYDDDEEDNEENPEEESKLTKVLVAIGKFILILLTILSFIALVVFTSVAIPLQQKTLAKWKGTINFGKNAPITTKPRVIRESNGILHIEGENVRDLCFAQGVATAQERMWQLEYNKRRATGTLAAVMGRDALQSDILAHTLNLKSISEQNRYELQANTQTCIQAYVDGINHFHDTKPTLAPEFHYLKIKEASRFEVSDVIAISKLHAWEQSSNSLLELLRYSLMQKGLTKARVDELIPHVAPSDQYPSVLDLEDVGLANATQAQLDANEALLLDDSLMYQVLANESTINVLESNLYDVFDRTGGNNWVVSGNHTADRKPILATDPHLKLRAPGALHLVHLKSQEQGLNVIGSAIVGVPGVLMGRNDYLSWGVTPALVDQIDFFAMDEVSTKKTYKRNGNVYEYQGRNVDVQIKGEADATNVRVLESEIGPVVNDLWNIPGQVLSMSWASLKNDTTLDAHFNAMLSTDYNSFLNNIKRSTHASSYTYADTNNNIAFVVTGRVPIRKLGHSGRFVVSGADSKTDYNGILSFDDLPRSVNPTKGYFASTDNRITPRGYPRALSLDVTNGILRANRIKQQFNNITMNSVDIESTKALQTDTYSTLYHTFKPFLRQLQKNVSEEYEPWLAKITNDEWGGKEDLYSQESSVFEQWYGQMGELTKSEFNRRWNNAPYLYNLLNNPNSNCNNQSCYVYAGKAFEDSIKKLEETYGSVPLWGSDVHEVDFEHELLGGSLIKCLAGKTIVGIGGTQTISHVPTEYPNLQSNHGAAYRQVVDMSGVKPDSFIVPLGQSGNFLSPGYDDLLNTWKDGGYLDMKRDGYNTDGGHLELINE